MPKSIPTILIVSAVVIALTSAYPGGAPASVCHKDPQKRVRRPHHGNATAQPHDRLPYAIVADTDRYAAGETIRISIGGSETFRGFFVQARDRRTGKAVGGFLSAANTTLLGDCATITHADPADKQYAFLVWQAPAQQSGHVDFSGSIVKRFDTFWTDIRAVVQHEQQPPEYEQPQQFDAPPFGTFGLL